MNTNREKVRKKAMELIERDYPKKLIETVNKILDSGEIDTSNYEGNYEEAMTVLWKALEEEAFQYKPLSAKRWRVRV